MYCEKMRRDCFAEVDLTFLFDVSNIITNSHDIHKDLESVLAKLCEFLSAQHSMITILNRNFSTILIGASYGLTEEEKNRGVYQIGEGIVGKVVRTKKAMVIPDITTNDIFLNRMGVVTDTPYKTAFLCVPIISNDQIRGTLSIHKRHRGNADFSSELKFMNVVGLLIARNVAMRQKQIEELEELREENRRLKGASPVKPDNIEGNSSLMRDLYELIHKVAPTNTTVMIRGESGVGKELIAEAIHKASSRANGPFVKVNCSALPETLIESELFGHEKGSFTGANEQHMGRFEMANGGTIFLDEIGDVPLSMQVKLLRALQQRQFERVGGTKTISVNVRVITATNRNLEEMIKQNTFREDFYYRINVFPIYVPSLRERRTDIPILVDHFINKLNKVNGTAIKRITSGALDLLMIYHWPGNIRELENVIERSMVLSSDNVIRSYQLPPTLQSASSSDTNSKGSLNIVMEKVEKQMIIDTLIATRGNSAKAAHLLGITERIIGLRIQKYAIDVQNYKHLSDNDNS
jgi:Nif-specific regulatory protein